MSISKPYKKISWLLLSGALLLTGSFAVLGFWQLHRAEEKRLIQEDIEQSIAAPVIQLSSTIGDGWTKLRYRRVEASGYFGNKFFYYLDNRVYQGKAGYHIISPFYLSGDNQEDNSQTIILVNRGWVNVGSDRKILPEVGIPSGNITLKGRLSAPRSKPPLIPADEMPDAYSSNVWTYLDVAYVAKINNINLEPYIILQENDINDGLKRQLPSYESKVTMHIGYAIQWFAFALFVIIAFIKNSITTEKSI